VDDCRSQRRRAAADRRDGRARRPCRVGLEDAPLGTQTGNVAWVEEAVRLVRENGGEPATAAEVRAALK
jgi:hypothetical protein